MACLGPVPSNQLNNIVVAAAYQYQYRKLYSKHFPAEGPQVASLQSTSNFTTFPGRCVWSEWNYQCKYVKCF